jgi:ferric-dicitrate binding protein FerR (iron transport regulator)
LRLADGSSLWLDSNAKVRAPGPRRIEVEGRVYGEIAKDPAHPFVFTGAKGQRAEVLGTTLVVDFATAVSVFTGEVRVSQAGQTTEVGAGEEALFGNGRLVSRRIMDTGAALAWFDRLRAFHFHNTPLATAMREVAGWYHLTILNPGDVRGVGIVYDPLPRDLPADSALAMLRKVERPYADIKKTNDSTWLITASPINP